MAAKTDMDQTPDKFRQRLEMLFIELEGLADKNYGVSPSIRREIDALRCRIEELEREVLESEKRCALQENHPVNDDQNSKQHSTAPILYETDHFVYAYAGDKQEQLNDPGPILSDGKDALSVPLIASGQDIGELRMALSDEHDWTSDEIGLANAVAQQVSLQVQNLRLLSATETARAEAEAATRRFMHEGWDSYLDAIHQNERVGYAYDQDSLVPFTEKLPANSGYQIPLDLVNEQIGSLYLRTDPDHPLSEEEKELVAAVARQTTQQVENIRLLADASRARAEAEEATRHLTRDSWKTVIDQQDQNTLAYVYDSVRVAPLTEADFPENVNFIQPLTVRGETIGQLMVAGCKDISPESVGLAAGVSAQLSIHIETLRLNEELRKRAAELQELDRLKSSFLANMSHELRTPLNSILGFSDVIIEGLDGPLTETMDNDLRLIQKNGQHLLHLINDVLDMAKIEAGRLNLNPEQFNVCDLVDEVVDLTSSLANDKSLDLGLDEGSDKGVELFADRMRIQQVMINIVNNAIKFTPKGSISIHVGYQNDRVDIHVSDTGVGIPPGQLETIFLEFAQVDTSTTRKSGGTGLGLPISRRLIEMHGGLLWAKSSGVPGEGSTFFIDLPKRAKIDEIEKLEK